MSRNLDLVAALTREIAEIAAAVVRDAEDAPPAEIGLEIAQRVCDTFAGQLVYVPMSFRLRLSERDQEMHQHYIRSGRNAKATAEAFECSIHTVYRRVALIEAAEHSTRQPDLFPSDQPEAARPD